MSAGVVAFTLTLLLGIQPVATDLYLPALPALGRAFGAPFAAVQLTLSALIIAFGIAQLAWGPVSDRWGRRPVLLAGLALFVLGGAGAVFAPSIGWLVGWRALQGIGMAAAVTCGRSIIRDLYGPAEGARVMSSAMSGLGVLAMLSPLAGSLTTGLFGWRSALGATALFGAAALAWAARRCVETLPAANPRATAPAQLLRNWRLIGAHPTFAAWTLLLCASYGGLFTMLAASSFVFIDVLGVGRLGYGLFLAANSLCYIAGTRLCRRMLARHSLPAVSARGAAFSLTGGVSMLALALAGVHGVWAIALPQWCFAVGHGVQQPCGQAGAVGPFAGKAGTAASLSGFLMMAVAFAVGLLLGRGMNGTVLPMAAGVGMFGTLVALISWTLVRRHGAPPPAAAAVAVATDAAV